MQQLSAGGHPRLAHGENAAENPEGHAAKGHPKYALQRGQLGAAEAHHLPVSEGVGKCGHDQTGGGGD